MAEKLDDNYIQRLSNTWTALSNVNVPVTAKETVPIFKTLLRYINIVHDDISYNKGLYNFFDVKESIKLLIGALTNLSRDTFVIPLLAVPNSKDEPEEWLLDLRRYKSLLMQLDKQFYILLQDIDFVLQNDMNPTPSPMHSREFSIGNMKIVMRDIDPGAPLEDKLYAVPQSVDKFSVIFKKAYELLKKKNLEKIWYGITYIYRTPETTNRVTNEIYRLDGAYVMPDANTESEPEQPGKDEIILSSDPKDVSVEHLIHELGHRYWFKFLTSEQRQLFKSYFWHEETMPVSDYGETLPDEDWAESFRWYILDKPMTSGQKARMERIIYGKSFNILKAWKNRLLNKLNKLGMQKTAAIETESLKRLIKTIKPYLDDKIIYATDFSSHTVKDRTIRTIFDTISFFIKMNLWKSNLNMHFFAINSVLDKIFPKKLPFPEKYLHDVIFELGNLYRFEFYHKDGNYEMSIDVFLDLMFYEITNEAKPMTTTTKKEKIPIGSGSNPDDLAYPIF